MYISSVFQCPYLSRLTLYHLNVLKDGVSDEAPALDVPDVVVNTSLLGSRTGRIRKQFKENHRSTCDIFQATLSGAKDKDGAFVLQKIVDKGIPNFPLDKMSSLLDANEAAADTMRNELQYTAAYHNASLVRDVCAHAFKLWDLESICDDVTAHIDTEGLRKIYNCKGMISPYSRKEGGGPTCVLGTHFNTNIHRFERYVTQNGLDCVVYRVACAIQDRFRPEMFPSSEFVSLDLITIGDDYVVQHNRMSVWDLFNPKTNRDAWPTELTRCNISMHDGEPLACALLGVQDFKDYSFDKLTIVQAELYRIVTMYMTRRLALTHGSLDTHGASSRDTRGTSTDQSPVPRIECLLGSATRPKGKEIASKSIRKSKVPVGGTKTSGDSGGAAARSHAECGPPHKKQKTEVVKIVKAPRIAFDVLLERFTMDEVIDFFRDDCVFSHFILVFLVPAEWSNLVPKNVGVDMGFAAPIVEKRHREHMKKHFDLTTVPSPDELMHFISNSPFLKGKMCVHASSTLKVTSRALIAQMRDTDVLFFRDTIVTNEEDVLSFTVKSTMYVTQETRSLQTTPFGSIIDDEPIYVSLRSAVNLVRLGDRELVMFKAKMTVYGVNCDEESI